MRVTEGMAERIRKLYGAGETKTDIARALGIDRATVTNYIGPEFRERRRQQVREYRKKRYGIDKEYTERCRARSRDHMRQKRAIQIALGQKTPSSRYRKKPITVYVYPVYLEVLARIAASEKTDIQAILQEAIDDFVRKRALSLSAHW